MKKLASRIVYESIYIIIWEKERKWNFTEKKSEPLLWKYKKKSHLGQEITEWYV